MKTWVTIKVHEESEATLRLTWRDEDYKEHETIILQGNTATVMLPPNHDAYPLYDKKPSFWRRLKWAFRP